MRRFLLLLLIWTCPLVGQSRTLDFDFDADGNEIQTGQVIDDEYSSWGININTVNYNRTYDLGITFDSDNPTGGDSDLRTDQWGYGSAKNADLYNILIISERNYDGNNDGLIDVPDDEAGGNPTGYFDFESDHTLVAGWMYLVDIENTGVEILFWNDGQALLSESIAVSGTHDNSLIYVEFSGFEYDHMRVMMNEAGAVGHVMLVPEPEFVAFLSMLAVVMPLVLRRRAQRLQAL